MFSLYQRTLLETSALGMTPQDLGDVTLVGDEGSMSPAQFKARVWSLARWCRISEQLVLDRNLRDARIFAGFQRFSRMVPVAKRFAQLARVAQHVTVLGEPDEKMLPLGIAYVPLANSEPLANEWFLLVESRDFQALLSAVALDRFGEAPLIKRRFLGLTTHNEQLVRAARELLVSRTGR
jgi:DICT domain-containing protein